MTQERTPPGTRQRVAVYFMPDLNRRIRAYARATGISHSNAIAVLAERGLQNAGQAALDYNATTGDPL